jgi:hypothetical protein
MEESNTKSRELGSHGALRRFISHNLGTCKAEVYLKGRCSTGTVRAAMTSYSRCGQCQPVTKRRQLWGVIVHAWFAKTGGLKHARNPRTMHLDLG